MLNREFQIRSRRAGLVSVGEVLQELVERAAVRQSFYRPQKPVSPRPRVAKPKKSRASEASGHQLELPFPASSAAPAPASSYNRAKPLLDLFSEAYPE